MKVGIVPPNGLQFSLRAEVQLKAQELEIPIEDQQTALMIQELLDEEKKRDTLLEALNRASERFNEQSGHVEKLTNAVIIHAKHLEVSHE